MRLPVSMRGVAAPRVAADLWEGWEEERLRRGCSAEGEPCN